MPMLKASAGALDEYDGLTVMTNVEGEYLYGYK